MATRTPRSRSRASAATQVSMSSSSALSVISSTSRSAGIPVLRSTSTTSSTKSSLASCCAATLTATEGWCRSLCISAPARQASRSTQLPSGTMSPLCSATGMNSTGGSSPRVGCSQRTSASKPVICCVSRSTVGW